MNIKLSLIAGAIAMMATQSVSAATYNPGGKTPDKYSEGSSNYLFDLSYGACASQHIYSVTELDGLTPQVASDGSTTYALIDQVSLPFYMGMAYYLEGEAEITVYLTPYSETTFAEEGKKYLWADCQADGTVSGTATISAEDDDVVAAAYGEDMVTVNVKLDNPLKYTGDCILMTVVTSSSMEDADYEYWFMGTYNFGAGRVCSGINKGSDSMSGTIPSTSSTLPIVTFSYTTETTEPAGPTEEYGEHTVYAVGPYDTAGSSNASVGFVLPGAPDKYSNSYSQIIYTPVELAELYKVDASGVTTVDIDELTFKFNDKGDMYEGSFAVTVYIQNYDGTTFPIVNNNPQWIAVDKTISGTAESDVFYYDMFDELELTAKFNSPLRYEGKSLLVTFVTESELEGLSSGALIDCVFKGAGTQSAIKSSNSALDDLTGDATPNNGTSTSVWIPVIKLGATPVTTGLSQKPVMFENVVASINKIDVTGFSNLTSANVLSITFDLANGDESADYSLKLGNTNLGTLHGTHGVINYVEYPAADLTLTVTPVAEGQMGSSVKITIDEIDALLPAPGVTAGETAMYSEYTAHKDKSAAVQGIASFYMTTPVPVAFIKGQPTVNQTKVVTSSMSWDLPEPFKPFLPAGNYNDYAANNGRISYYNSNITTATISKGRFVNPAAVSMDVKFSVDYPMIVLNTPSIDTEIATSAASNGAYQYKTVNREYDNGSGYSYTKTQCTAKLNASSDGVLTLEVTFPGELTAVINDKENSIDFFAPVDHKIHIAWVPKVDVNILSMDKAPADMEWAATDDNIYNHDMSQAGDIHVKTTDADGNDVDYIGYTIDPNGEVTGVESIAIDNTADSEAVYYNLNGVRVDNPANGIYIMRRGNTVSKIMVR